MKKEIDEVLVEWDDNKNKINIKKHGDILFVVYTIRNDANRIISARVATATERMIYYGE